MSKRVALKSLDDFCGCIIEFYAARHLRKHNTGYQIYLENLAVHECFSEPQVLETLQVVMIIPVNEAIFKA
ncbi:hypothetical protein LXL04_025365 [Taraxacum kok-saghyz]